MHCARLGCKREGTREFGRVYLCDECQPVGGVWARANICSRCGKAAKHPVDRHLHNVRRDGFEEAICCTCAGGSCEVSPPQESPVTPAQLRALRRSPLSWGDATAKTEQPPPPVVTLGVTERGRYVVTEKTGLTAHSTGADGFAVCGSRNVKNASQVRYLDALPEGVGHCWKCRRDE